MIENGYKFSICIPAFKVQFLKECINSILSQSYSHLELIILNDHSPFPVEEIVNAFKDTRIKYFRNESNTGAVRLVDNWNKCLELASGEFLVMMGDDDLMDPNYLSEFLILIDSYPSLDVYHCRSKIIDEQSIPYEITPINPSYENIFDYLWSCLSDFRRQYLSDFVYRVKALKNGGGFFDLPLAWGSDFITAFKYCGSLGIAHTNKCVMNYRVNQFNITSQGGIELKRKANLTYIEWVRNFIDSETPNSLEDQLKLSMIKKQFPILTEHYKLSFLKQYLGSKNKFFGIFTLVKKRKQFDLTFTDCMKALPYILFRKIFNV